MQPKPIYSFGQVLWDCLPSGLFLGGAPLNMAYHCAQLGAHVHMISAVGNDFLGAEALRRMQTAGVQHTHTRTHPTLPTGTVIVELSADGQPTYTINPHVAWSEINPAPETLTPALETAGAFVYGCAATKHPLNAHALNTLLATPGPTKICDVNLREPYDLDNARAYAAKADFLKLNEDELSLLLGTVPPNLKTGIQTLSKQMNVPTVCVTCGSEGATLLYEGTFHHATTPSVNVADTVGAGDAFMATLTTALVSGALEKDPAACLAKACKLGAYVASQQGPQPTYNPSDVL